MNRPRFLTATFVKSVREPGRYGDGRGGNGLSLLVRTTKNGRYTRRFHQRIRIDGRVTNIALGQYPFMTLAEARAKAIANRRAIALGQRPNASKIPTFEAATEKVISLHAPQWKPGGLTEEHWRSSLATYAKPIASKRLDQITSAHVMGCVSPLWHAKPEMARKVLRRIGAVMSWAIAKNYRADNPADRKVITAALGKNTNGGGNFAALHHSKVAEALEIIDGSGAWWASKSVSRFLALTATRSGEARLATWDEIDFATATWSILADRTKTGKALRVPLSAAAFRLLGESRRV